MPSADHAVLREVVERLAPIDRTACSPGEHEAARWLADRLAAAGAQVTVETDRAATNYAKHIGALCAASAVAGIAALGGFRKSGGLVAAVAGALIADDVSNGVRPWRKAVAEHGETLNVIARAGDLGADRTVVVLAHHDAAPTGYIFDQSGQAWAGQRFPDVIERIDTALPLWWPVVAGPVLVALGAVRGSGATIRAGLGFAVFSTAAFADIARSPTVPGANDNLSADAVLVDLAETLRDAPVEGVEVMLVSCGAEEVLQGGIHGFAQSWFGRLDRERTWFVNLDTVGSPRLVMVEGEGPFVMEDYARPEFRDLVATCAERVGVSLRRGMRARSSTDSVIPSRAGFPIATIASMDANKALSNYHLMSDVPDNLDYGTVADAARLTEEVIRAIGRGEPA